MPAVVRVPIRNTLMGSDYTLTVALGGNALAAELLADTGSAMLVVDGLLYDPAADGAASTTQLLQSAQYQSGNFLAAVVRTAVAFPGADHSALLALADVNVAVTYELRQGTFGMADGIFGLAFRLLDSALLMPADTTAFRYGADQTGLGKAADLEPYVDQLSSGGTIGNCFAFSVARSITRMAQDDPRSDPANSGVFVLGDCRACTDLFTGDFTSVAVLHAQYYNVGLLAVQVGALPPIRVKPLAPGSTLASNAIVDSGSSALTFEQTVFDAMLACFATLDASFPHYLHSFSVTSGMGCDHSLLDLGAWPKLLLTLTGADGTPANVTLLPTDYWQQDAFASGTACAMLGGDGGMLGGQTILGLPLFSGHYVVFDRTASNGHGVVAFAERAAAG